MVFRRIDQMLNRPVWSYSGAPFCWQILVDKRSSKNMSTARFQLSGYLSEGPGRIKNVFKDILSYMQIDRLIVKSQMLQVLISKALMDLASLNIGIIL